MGTNLTFILLTFGAFFLVSANWLNNFFPVLKESTNFIDALGKEINLISELEKILFPDFVDKEPFPKFIVVVDSVIVVLTHRGVEAEVLANRTF